MVWLVILLFQLFGDFFYVGVRVNTFDHNWNCFELFWPVGEKSNRVSFEHVDHCFVVFQFDCFEDDVGSLNSGFEPPADDGAQLALKLHEILDLFNGDGWRLLLFFFFLLT